MRDEPRRRPGRDPEVLAGDVSTAAGRRAFTASVFADLTGRVGAINNV